MYSKIESYVQVLICDTTGMSTQGLVEKKKHQQTASFVGYPHHQKGVVAIILMFFSL